ncbi:MAG: hypothetical protein AAFX06_11970 [Planctomycetota bacterium]
MIGPLLLAWFGLAQITPACAQNQDRTYVVSAGFESRKVRGATAYDRLQAPDVVAWDVAGWDRYDRLWKEFAASPNEPALRKYLGFPIGESATEFAVLKVTRGRSAPRWLGWRAGSYSQIESPHFRIYSRADEESGREVAQDLERVYWIWTQVFYPFWDAQAQVALHLKNVSLDQPVGAQLSAGTRLASRKKLRVVLFRDAEDYQRTLAQAVPGIERSTGFYSDERLTSFFYPTEDADSVATRRHELVHQLFREATVRGTLGSRSPGMESGFWLVEGIAGYFESLVVGANRASLGGWDSPRLQFARYRMLSSGDRLPLDELVSGGQRQVQRRNDISRWYAHAIARTHQFLDGGTVAHRRWVYQQLAELYGIRIDVPGAEPPSADDRVLVDFLRIDDALVRAFPPNENLTELCLSGCEVTDSGLKSMGGLTRLSWLDLSRLPIGSDAVTELCPRPETLERLSLEATKVDDGISGWLSNARQLTELDLSWTRCGDPTAKAYSATGIETLWLTGSVIGDGAIPELVKLRRLESLDVQRTKVTTQGLAQLKRAKPQWSINPLQLRVAAPEN